MASNYKINAVKPPYKRLPILFKQLPVYPAQYLLISEVNMFETSLKTQLVKQLISPYNITATSNVSVMRIKEMITKDKMP